MSMIETFNSTVPDAVNKSSEDYEAIIGKEDFTPESAIVNSEDFNCGALCNELELVRTASEYYTQSFDIDIAEDENLDALVTTFIDIPRRNNGEEDSIYRKRFKSIAVQKSNPRRTLKWSIIDALSYFLSDAVNQLQIIELFEVTNTYFELRIEGAISYDDAMFLNNPEQSYLNQEFVGGSGVGSVISYVGEIVDRIKAAGVDYDIVFIAQDRFTKTCDCIIGTVQIYKTVDAVVKASVSFTKTSDAVIVV